MKKFASLLLVLALCMGLTVPALAAQDTKIGPLTITGVTGTETVAVSRDSVLNSTELLNSYYTRGYCFASQQDGKMTVYQVPTGTSLDLYMMSVFYICDVHMVNGVLSYVDNSGVSLSNVLDYDFNFLSPDAHVTFLAEGYYAICFSSMDASDVIYDTVIHVTDTPAQPVQPAAPSFADVTASDYFYDSVNWAVDKAITNGTSATTFSPSATCTQAQIITFLWRANGSPAGFDPSGLGAAPTDYYYDAVNWAAAKGIIDASFSASAPCTRAAAVTYMYRNAGSPAVSYGGKFADVAADATGSAVQWALDKGVTTGTSDVTFSPDATCTRGQIVTFLYRDLA